MTIVTLDAFFAAMSPRRSLYVSDKGSEWFITYGGGRVATEVVERALATGRLCREYSGQPGCYILGDQTIDRDRFLAIPPKQRRNMEPLYLPEPERDLTLAAAYARPRP